ncbi:methylsterol monooxygenase 1-like [Ptychodera flava]|uniref:methylsterol monooxygenase 1-like n=1 Tax=Ptychodera flava TaxID=63121 RepID=UPI003969D8D8
MAENGTILTTVRLATEYLEYLPDNPLRSTMEYYWTSMLTNYSKFDVATWISFLYHEVLYFAIVCQRFCVSLSQPCRSTKYNSKNQSHLITVEGFKLLVLNHFFVQFPLILGTYTFTELFGIPYDWESMPAWYDTAWRVYLCAVFEDTWHYFMHRLLHHKRIYKYIHKLHHNFQAPFGMVAEYAHPVETVVLGFGFFIGVLLLTNHFIMIWAWLLFRLFETVDVHTGYDLPFNPLHLLPFYGGARFHDFHHMNFQGNYSSTFTWWDKIFGTDQQFKEFTAKQEKSLKSD